MVLGELAQPEDLKSSTLRVRISSRVLLQAMVQNMSEAQRNQFGVEVGEILILARDAYFVSRSNLEIHPTYTGDIFICLDIFETHAKYAQNSCIILHPSAGLLTFSFQYQLHKTAWRGTFVGK